LSVQAGRPETDIATLSKEVEVASVSAIQLNEDNLPSYDATTFVNFTSVNI
jgi:hypothetical protein